MQKVVLVTGASSGIGRATALALNENGYTVYAAARRLERMEDLKELGIRPIKLDVSDEQSMVDAVQNIIQEAGSIDVLVNNAGYGSYGAVEDVPMLEARRQIEVNLFGLARMIQLVLPGMRSRRSGKIVNITSIGGKMATPFGGWYHASKFAVEGLSDSLRNEERPFGIDVIVIEPGGVKSEWGTIAMQNLEKTIRGSAYEDLANRVLKAISATENHNAEASVIGNLIVRALAAPKPRARYRAGYMSEIVLLRRFISDAMFDWFIMNQFG
ncbi:MAG: oxidoreductase [Anaerolineae bacterium]|nr:oxidoreductase [Anaerolineae bacterium]